MHANLNYLAHFLLAGESQGLLIGNFIADSVKGNKFLDYPEEIREGIIMHRAIDHFTDTHPVAARTRKRLHGEFRHYAAVILDVFYDHFLAANFEAHGPEPLPDYSRRIYQMLESQAEVFPEKSRFILPFMIRHDWLMAYQEIEGINRVLTGMARRTTFVSGMENAADALRRDYDAYREDFEEFFPQVLAFTESYRKK